MPSGEKFAEAYVELRAETDRLKRELNSLKGNVKKESKGMGQLFGKGFITAMAGYITVAGAAALASSLKNMAAVGAEVRNVSRAFGRLEDSNQLLIDMKEATKGTISNLELMRTAIKGIDLGATNEQMKTFTEFARFQALRQGGDQARILEDILGGVLRGSTELLDNFGISLTAVNREIETLAQESGTSATKLTAVQRRVLMVEAAVRLMNKRMDEFGDTPLTDAEKINRASVAWKNFTDKFSLLASPVVADGLNAVAGALDSILENVRVLEQSGVGGTEAFFLAITEGLDRVGKKFGILYDIGNIVKKFTPYHFILPDAKKTREQLDELRRLAKTTPGGAGGGGGGVGGPDEKPERPKSKVEVEAKPSVMSGFKPIKTETKDLDRLETLKQRSGEALQDTTQAADFVYEKYNTMYEGISDVSEYALQELTEQGMNALGTLERGFESFFFELMDENDTFVENVMDGFKSMAQAFIMEVNRMIARWLAFQALKFIAGSMFGPAGTSAVAAIGGEHGGRFEKTSGGVKKIAAFAGGGSFVVPPGFQNDTYPMFVSSREKVDVTPAHKVGEDVKMLSKVVDGIQAMNANIARRLGGVEKVMVGGELQGRDLQLAVERSQRLEGRYRGS